MATVTLRPSADGYNNVEILSVVGGPYVTSSGTTGYNLINETTADGTSTMIYWTGNVVALSLGNTPRHAYFQLNTSTLPNNIRINSATVYANSKKTQTTGGATLAFALAWGTVPTSNISALTYSSTVSPSTSFSTQSQSVTVQTVDTSGSSETMGLEQGLWVGVQAVAYKGTGIKDGDTILQLSQLYVVIDYTEIHMSDVWVTQSLGGTLRVTPSGSVENGTSISVTATPSAGYELDKLYVNGALLSPATTFTANADSEVTATWTPKVYSIIQGTSEHGSVTIPPSATYGSVVDVSVTPETGYQFDKLYVNGVEQTGSTFTMPAQDTTVYAVFVGNPVTITVTQSTGGTISVSPSDNARVGDTVTITSVPDAGYELSEIFVNGSSIGTTSGSTFIAVTDSNVTATWTQLVAPNITIGTPTRLKISDETDYSQCSCAFTVDCDVVNWEARAVKNEATPARGVGLLVESGGQLSANETGIIYVDDEELTAGDGGYTISVYARSSSGMWSDGTFEATT